MVCLSPVFTSLQCTFHSYFDGFSSHSLQLGAIHFGSCGMVTWFGHVAMFRNSFFVLNINTSLKTHRTVYFIVFTTFSSSLAAQIYTVYIVNEVLVSRSKKNSLKYITWSCDFFQNHTCTCHVTSTVWSHDITVARYDAEQAWMQKMYVEHNDCLC